MSVVIHEREQDDGDVERYTKRAKLDDGVSSVVSTESTSLPQVLPPSHSLLGLPLPVIKDGQPLNFHEPDVGISEYIGRGDARIEGIIKQRLVRECVCKFQQPYNKSCSSRFTDFLVFEVDLDGKIIHLKSIGKPSPPGNDNDEVSVPDGQDGEGAMDTLPDSSPGKAASTLPNDAGSSQNLVWQDGFTTALTPFLDLERIQQIKDIYLQGRNPPRLSDSGWAGRKARSFDADNGLAQSVEQTTTPSEVDMGHKLGGRNKKATLDDRKVVSEVLVSDSLYLLTLMLSPSP